MVVGEKKSRSCSFVGKANRTKLFCFMLLYLLKQSMTIKEMEMYLASTGISFGYVEDKAPVWHKWGYLSRRHQECDKGTPAFEYRLLQKATNLLGTFQTAKPRIFRSFQNEVERCIGRVREQEHNEEWASYVSQKHWQRKIADNVRSLVSGIEAESNYRGE